MQIHAGRNIQQLGTFSVQQVLGGLASGQFLPTDIAWHEGLGDWVPLSSLAVLSAPPPAARLAFPPVEERGAAIERLGHERARDIAACAVGASRAEVLNGFIGSREFSNLAASYGIRAQALHGIGSAAAEIRGDIADTSTLRGNASDQHLFDGASVSEVRPNNVDLTGKVFRLYGATLNRAPDAGGLVSWLNGLGRDIASGGITLSQAAGGFVGSREFQKTYGTLDDEAFVNLLYRNVLGREADAGGKTFWTGKLAGGWSRADVVLGFSESREYQNRMDPALDAYMRKAHVAWNDVLEGGGGNDVLNGGQGSDIFIFRRGEGGHDTIHGFEPWDRLQLSGFGFASANDALLAMKQVGTDTVFERGTQKITFTDTRLSDMRRVGFNLS